MTDVESELVRRRTAGKPLVLATVVRVDGEPPSRPGEKLLIEDGIAVAGTLGCSEFDSAARADAEKVLQGRQPALHTYQHELGSVEVYLEPHLAAPVLLVLGRTPVGESIKRWAPEVGFQVVEGAKALPEGAFCVATDHDAPGLVEELAAVLERRPRFLGVMGSRRHTGPHLDALRRRGLQVDDIQTPVGLEIGARTAPEIALSILAGLVAVREGGEGGFKARRR